MISSTLFSVVAAVCSLVAVNGGIIQRGTVNCDSAQEWQAAFAYVAGNEVIYNDDLYTATQSTYNNTPPAHPDQWTFDGACTLPINNGADCTGIAAWQSTVAYVTGNEVTYNGYLWTAVQWNEASTPGGTSGAWKDDGACT